MRGKRRLTLDGAIEAGRLDDFIRQCEADGVRAARAEERRLARIETRSAETRSAETRSRLGPARSESRISSST